ncbi:MAG TPA: LemA family protein [Chitinophagales bacterium]|nr:LemA family protein [Chitinophagales bacterium]
MIFLLLLITLLVVVGGLYNTLLRKRRAAKIAFQQLKPLIAELSDVVGKYIELIRQTSGQEKEVYAQINKLRWQATSRKVPFEQKAFALNKMYALFVQILQHQLPATGNTRFTDLEHKWRSIIAVLESEIDYYNSCAADFNTLAGKFPYKLVAQMLRFSQKPILKIT